MHKIETLTPFVELCPISVHRIVAIEGTCQVCQFEYSAVFNMEEHQRFWTFKIRNEWFMSFPVVMCYLK